MKPAGDYTLEEFDAIISLNVKAVFHCMKYELPMMIDAGGGGRGIRA